MKSPVLKKYCVFLSLALLCCLTACHRQVSEGQKTGRSETKEAKPMPSQVSVRLGESGANFLKRNPVGVKVNRQPAGLDFYSMDWNKPPHGTVKVDHGAHSFEVANATGIQTSEDQGELKFEGFVDYTVYAVLSESDSLPHETARNQIYGLLKNVMNAGWEQVVEPGDPRLSGRERLEYTLKTSNLNGLDATYLPTMSEWMRLADRTPWRFYADGIFMEIYFARDAQRMALDKPGSYLLTIELQAAPEYFRRYVEPSDRAKWKALVPGVLKDLAQQRLQQETALRAQGLTINEGYQAPPFPPSP